ncbi:MAG TPA: hypothetical protein VNM47_07000 [Terriglobia bacterium]|nr:hypothetical protein [Terriglobia bacterium]
MRMIRNITILVGLFAVLMALATTGARAQVLSTTSFTGTFTLPTEAQWGKMILPAGDYTLQYGGLFLSGEHMVTVESKTEGGPRGMILAGPRDDVSAAKDSLLCVREGDTLYVRALEMPLIGESIHFRIPHGVEVRSKVVAGHQNHTGKTQLALVAIGVDHVPTK